MAERGVLLCSGELGCPLNLALTTQLHNYVKANGWTFAEADAADDIVIVSCSTLSRHRQGLAAAVSYFAGAYPGKKVTVMGCFLKADMVSAPNVAYVPMLQKERFDELFGSRVPLRSVPEGATLEDDAAVKSSPNRALHKAFSVTVQAGCLSNCAFCIGKTTFPKVQSVPIAEVAARCEDGLSKGYKNFALGGSDVASYGRDLGCGVADLFEALFSKVFDGRRKVTLGVKSFEPAQFLRHLNALKPFFATGKIGWICLPIQSGSDRVLRSMNRRYRAADVLSAVRELRELAPSLRIETDFIFCYPTETAEDFEASLTLLDRFDHCSLLTFCPHQGTPAFDLKETFDGAEKERRTAIIRALNARAPGGSRPECHPGLQLQLPAPIGDSGLFVLSESWTPKAA